MANEVGYANATKQLNYTYDVFVSFRRADTRNSFMGLLYHALRQKRLKIKEDSEVNLVEEIFPALVKSMEESRILIVFITENYPSSRWCLEELVKMLELMEFKNHKVCPVFYGVDPSDVRHLRNSFGNAMARHEKSFEKYPEKVQKWRSALFEVTNLSGWHFQPRGEGAGYENVFADKIADWIFRSRSLFRFSYDVYLSFTGEDIRYSFTDFLCNVLRQEGFKTFVDDEGWWDEDQLSQSHILAIKESKFSIVVFSENYAKHPCCLDAIVEIEKHMSMNKQLVYPIFHKVAPAAVKEAMEKMFENEPEKVRKWRSALSEVAGVAGKHIKSENKYEYKTIKRIVELVNKAFPRYDVFLSFRGPDTRYTFTGNLYYALCKKGIKTFMDDQALEGGEKISDALINAIEGSRISIIVFSENYASSSSCLDELFHISQCARVKYHKVLPIYYKVERAYVQDKEKSYVEDMEKHETKFGKECVQKWRSAVYDVANSEEHRHHSYRDGYDYEHKLIDKIVEKIGLI